MRYAIDPHYAIRKICTVTKHAFDALLAYEKFLSRHSKHSLEDRLLCKTSVDWTCEGEATKSHFACVCQEAMLESPPSYMMALGRPVLGKLPRGYVCTMPAPITFVFAVHSQRGIIYLIMAHFISIVEALMSMEINEVSYIVTCMAVICNKRQERSQTWNWRQVVREELSQMELLGVLHLTGDELAHTNHISLLCVLCSYHNCITASYASLVQNKAICKKGF